jgi:F-type H+-transporting ATPase subunit epsilon
MADQKKALTLDMVTPDREVISSVTLQKLVVPAEEGEITILPDHRPLITTLTTGTVVFHYEHGEWDAASISWGFAEIKDNHVVLLAETLELAREIDTRRATFAKEFAEKKLLTETLSEREFNKYQLKMDRAVSRIRAGRFGQ